MPCSNRHGVDTACVAITRLFRPRGARSTPAVEVCSQHAKVALSSAGRERQGIWEAQPRGHATVRRPSSARSRPRLRGAPKLVWRRGCAPSARDRSARCRGAQTPVAPPSCREGDGMRTDLVENRPESRRVARVRRDLVGHAMRGLHTSVSPMPHSGRSLNSLGASSRGVRGLSWRIDQNRLPGRSRRPSSPHAVPAAVPQNTTRRPVDSRQAGSRLQAIPRRQEVEERALLWRSVHARADEGGDQSARMCGGCRAKRGRPAALRQCVDASEFLVV